jgi:hypothetical protein
MPTDSEGEEDSDDDMPANPNHSKAARSMATTPRTADVDEATEGVKKMSMSRKERESMEAQQAKERYRKLHEAGKTDEAKADLARLQLIREKREAEAARKQVCDLFLGTVVTLWLTPYRRLRKRRRKRRQKPAKPRSMPENPRSARLPLARAPRRARSDAAPIAWFIFPVRESASYHRCPSNLREFHTPTATHSKPHGSGS